MHYGLKAVTRRFFLYCILELEAMFHFTWKELYPCESLTIFLQVS